jgi:hypothetical protein
MSNMSSPEIGKLVEAFSKAQAVMEGAVEDSQNPFFKSKYADLSSVWKACRKPLTDNGLCIIQTTEVDSDGTYLITTLAHSSGQWIKGKLPIILTKSDPQSLGSAITYYRRYSLSAMCGVCPADDDAESAMSRNGGIHLQKKEPVIKVDVKKDCEIIKNSLKNMNIEGESFDEYVEYRSGMVKKTKEDVIKSITEAFINQESKDKFIKGYSKWLNEKPLQAINQ